MYQNYTAVLYHFKTAVDTTKQGVRIKRNNELFNQLQEIVEKLRDPKTGCPWDRAQTPASLVPNFIEEIYEAVEAIEQNDNKLLVEELGDILLHILMQIEIAEESNNFTFDDVISNLKNKLIRRHPHIFTENFDKNKTSTSDLARTNWEKIKQIEKINERESILDGVPKNMPALIQAHRVQEKAASIGFDWDSTEPIIDKIAEEAAEVLAEINNDTPEKLLLEIGDLFFSVVNLSRKLKIDSETALRKSTEKFKDRFKKLERLAKERGINIAEADLATLDELWDVVKG